MSPMSLAITVILLALIAAFIVAEWLARRSRTARDDDPSLSG